MTFPTYHCATGSGPLTAAEEGPVVAVTGAAGFLGSVVVAQLLEGEVVRPREVRLLDRREPEGGDRSGVRCIQVDVRDGVALAEAIRAADLVVHCAAEVDWGRKPEGLLQAVNVGGTDNVIGACRAEGVGALVHVSTLDVVWTGEPVIDGDERLPYPEGYPNAYCRTKAEAERHALAADGSALARPTREGGTSLRVAVVRPCAIYGEADPYHAPPLLDLARHGRLVRLGKGQARSQFCYVGNVAHLVLLAGRSLLEDGRAAGEVYFATEGEPQNFFDAMAPMVEAAGFRMPPAERGLPRLPLWVLGALAEATAAVVRPVWTFTPTLTRFAVDFVTLDFTFRTDKAARHLGYAPRYAPDEAVARTVDWIRAREQA